MASINPKKVVIYINIKSCHGGEILSDLVLLGEKWGFEVCALTKLSQMENVIRGFDPELEWLIIVGGDGTIFRVFNGLIKEKGLECLKKIVTVPIGAGTINCLSDDWAGYSKSPLYNLKLVIRALQKRNLPIKELPLLKIEWDENILYGVKFVAGPPIRILDEYNKFVTTPFVALLFATGYLTAALMGWPKRVVDIFEQVQSRITVDGRELPFGEQMAISMSSIEQLVPGVYPYQGICGPGQAYSLVYGAHYREALFQLPLVTQGFAPLNTDRYFNQPVNRMVVNIAPGTRLIITVDGDTFIAEEGQLTVTVGPTMLVATSPSKLRLLDKVAGPIDFWADRLQRLASQVIPTKK